MNIDCVASIPASNSGCIELQCGHLGSLQGVVHHSHEEVLNPSSHTRAQQEVRQHARTCCRHLTHRHHHQGQRRQSRRQRSERAWQLEQRRCEQSEQEREQGQQKGVHPLWPLCEQCVHVSEWHSVVHLLCRLGHLQSGRVARWTGEASTFGTCVGWTGAGWCWGGR